MKLLGGQERPKGLTFEPLDGFSNFKSLNWCKESHRREGNGGTGKRES